MRRAGVTSKAGLAAGLPSGEMRTRTVVPSVSTALDEADFFGVALLDGNLLHAVMDRPVDGG